MEYDVIVLGGGLSGYVAAARAAELGKRVLILTDGLGSFPFLPGHIDVWGYGSREPLAGIAEHLRSQPGHPWGRLRDVLSESMAFFRSVCAEQGLGFAAPTQQNVEVPTPLGGSRPAFMVPDSQYVPGWQTAPRVLVVGLAQYRDFFPRVVAHGVGSDREARAITVSLDLPRHLDSFTLAGCLEKEAYQDVFLQKVGEAAGKQSLVLVPAVFGLESAAKTFARVQSLLGVPLMEISTLPPSMPGLRIYAALRRWVMAKGVRVTNNVKVNGAWFSRNGCAGVTASISGREHKFTADSFVLATGSFVSSGFTWQGRLPAEPVMGLPVTPLSDDFPLTDGPFLDSKGKEFMRLGIEVDDNLNPTGPSGEVIYKNVFVTGSKLAGYDFSVEKSGTGIAVASGYKAGSLA